MKRLSVWKIMDIFLNGNGKRKDLEGGTKSRGRLFIFDILLRKLLMERKW